MKTLAKISERHTILLRNWVSKGLTFKFWGDNVDKKRSLRDARSDHQGKMLHMFSVLAASTRVPRNDLSPVGFKNTLMSISASTFLPGEHDVTAVHQNLKVIVSRLLVKYILCLKPLQQNVNHHIMHRYSSAMAEKSDVVVLDVLIKNEACHSDMHDILTTLHNYLPEDYLEDRRVLSGGDQMTCERERGAQRYVMDGDTPRERLELLEPQMEDWHCLVTLLQVAWKTLFKSSPGDHGTLGFFKALLGRSAVQKDPKKAVDASVDFFTSVYTGHIVEAACRELGISTAKSTHRLPTDILKGSTEAKKTNLLKPLPTKCWERAAL